MINQRHWSATVSESIGTNHEHAVLDYTQVTRPRHVDGQWPLPSQTRHLSKTVRWSLRAYSVEKLFLFGVGLTDSILATLQEIDRDDGAKAGSAGSVVLRVLD